MDSDFEELLQQFQIPEAVRDALSIHGYDSTLTFGFAFSSMQILDQHIQKFLPTGDDDPTSPLCARIRALWTRCNTIHTSPPIPAAQTFPPTPAATPAASPMHLRKTILEKFLMLTLLPRSGFGLLYISRKSTRHSSTSQSNFVSANTNTVQ